MSQVVEDFHVMCRVGYGCGLQTVNEAFHQLSSHYDAFFLISEAVDRLQSLDQYICSQDGWGDTIRSVMGDAWCEQQDAEEAAYWEGQP